MRTIGVISDTHGPLRPEAADALRGSELILHAGDVGTAETLEALEQIAPTIAVRGNTDYGALAQRLPVTEVVDLASADGTLRRGGEPPPAVLAYMLHIRETIDLDPAGAGFRLVVFGHTHEPLIEQRGPVLWLNPGSAGPRRFKLPVTVARLRVDTDDPTAPIEAEIVDLTVA